MLHVTRKHLTAGILGLILATVPFSMQAFAEAAGERAGADRDANAVRVDHDNRSNSGWGWLGLLGLVGLAGLIPKKSYTGPVYRSGEERSR